MSDEHEDLARRQEREVADLQDESDELAQEIEGAKADVADLESTVGIATPDPAIEGDGEPAAEGTEPPPETRVTGRDSQDDERVNEGV